MSISQKSFREMTGAEKAFIAGTIIWIFLQVVRFIALILIADINAGDASEAWRYPAYLDLVAAVFAVPLIWAVWDRRGLFTWALTVSYWVISIVDHIGNFVTTTFVGPPTIAEGTNPYMVPAIQTILDIVFLALLFVPTLRSLFFRIESTAQR